MVTTICVKTGPLSWCRCTYGDETVDVSTVRRWVRNFINGNNNMREKVDHSSGGDIHRETKQCMRRYVTIFANDYYNDVHEN